MGRRKVIVTQTAADQVAAVSWFIESQGLTATAEKFTDDAYNFFIKLADTKRTYALCREISRSNMGYKCVPYKKKYTVVFIESDAELIILEFVSSKTIFW